MHLIWTAAIKEAVFFAYLVAIPLHLLRCKNAFSTKCRNLYRLRSNSLCILRFAFGGITTFIPWLSAWAIISSLSYALSAKRCSASIPSIRRDACLLSCVVPSVIIILIGIPCASTAKCTFVLSPLLSDSCLDCLLLLQPHEDALWYDLRLS